jgi:predicted aconitase with swiveling domain
MKIRGKVVCRGRAFGKAVVSKAPISFLGGVDPRSGRVVERGHPLEGRSISRKVLILPRSKGSTVGSYVIYHMKKLGTAPIAFVCKEADEVTAVGAIIARIPMLHRLEVDATDRVRDGAEVRVDAVEGYLEVV